MEPRTKNDVNKNENELKYMSNNIANDGGQKVKETLHHAAVMSQNKKAKRWTCHIKETR